jgi:hypothetical protein
MFLGFNRKIGKYWQNKTYVNHCAVFWIRIGSDPHYLPDPDRHPGHADLYWYQLQAYENYTIFQNILICCLKYLKL